MGIELSKINALAELERTGWDYEPSGNEEIKCKCPVHDDKNPSVTLNIKKNKWICHASSCKARGDIVSFLAFVLQCERKVVLVDLDKRYDLKLIKTVNQATIERYHNAIWESGVFLQELYKRGLKDSDIREARLGYDNGRIMIPVYDKDGRVINIRKYLPGAPGPEKMKNLSGYTTKALYQIDQLKYPVIWICGGEMKALASKSYLNELNTGSISVTAGEGAWDIKFTPLFKGKHVFVCMDVDKGGIAASNTIAENIKLSAQSVHIVSLPLDREKYPKGDLNDWIVDSKVDANSFDALMKSAHQYRHIMDEEDNKDEPPKECKLIDAAKAEHVGVRLSCSVIISAMDSVPFLLPSVISVKCTKDQDFCGSCRISSMDPDADGVIKATVEKTNPVLIDMVDSNNIGLEDKIKKSISIPHQCKIAKFKVLEHYNALDTRLSVPLEVSGSNNDHIIQPAIVVCDQYLDLNTPYQIEGKPYPSPKNSQAVLIVDKIIEKEDGLTTFKFENIDDLKKFQPDEWTIESLDKKLCEIYTDLSHNVTRIFQRQDLHLGIDLCFHSVLYFNLDGRIQNGWVNCLIAGDSSQGKSEASTRLVDHYGTGVRYDCKNASEAGLLGGLQQMGTRWFVSWGVIPQHDRRLVIMEEIKGANETVLGRLTDMRSSGYAALTKIEQRRAYARTRLMMISNPRGDRNVASYSYGVEIIKELMGSLEDIRRFDFAVILSSSEIDSNEINKMVADVSPKDPVYDSEASRKLVIWSWTRKPGDIIFSDEVKRHCINSAIKMCQEFTEAMPLCDKGTMRYKIARLAVALACRTFSTDDNEQVIVRMCHVDYVTRYLTKMYTEPHFGYKDFTKAIEYTSNIMDSGMVKKCLLETKHPKDLVEQLLHTEYISLADLQDWCEIDRDAAQKILSILVRKRAMFRKRYNYHKSEGFIELLREISNGISIKQDTSDVEEY